MKNKIWLVLLLLIGIICKIYFVKSTFGGKGDENLYERFKSRFNVVKGKRQLNDVDMVYAITMPNRKEYITKQINTLGVTCTYFDAISPKDLTTEDYDTLSSINNPRSDIFKKYTRLAVLLSFILCFMDSLEKGYSTIIVFEDDMSINVDLQTLNESLTEFKNSYCDIFYMGYCFLNCNQLLYINKYKKLVEIPNRDLLCCHSMCIKTKVLPGLIEYCFPMNFNSDELFRNYYMMNDITICVPRTVYFIQNRASLESLNESEEDPEFFKTCKF